MRICIKKQKRLPSPLAWLCALSAVSTYFSPAEGAGVQHKFSFVYQVLFLMFITINKPKPSSFFFFFLFLLPLYLFPAVCLLQQVVQEAVVAARAHQDRAWLRGEEVLVRNLREEVLHHGTRPEAHGW